MLLPLGKSFRSRSGVNRDEHVRFYELCVLCCTYAVMDCWHLVLDPLQRTVVPSLNNNFPRTLVISQTCRCNIINVINTQPLKNIWLLFLGWRRQRRPLIKLCTILPMTKFKITYRKWTFLSEWQMLGMSVAASLLLTYCTVLLFEAHWVQPPKGLFAFIYPLSISVFLLRHFSKSWFPFFPCMAKGSQVNPVEQLSTRRIAPIAQMK